jgi:TP901 family phage tail tape measure protein
VNAGDITATIRLIDALSGPVKAAAAAAQSAFAGMQSSSAAATGAMAQTQQRLKADLKAVEDQIRQLEQTAKTSGAGQAQALDATRAEAAKLTDMIGRLGSAMQAEAAAAAAATQATDRHKQAQESDEQATRRRASAQQDLINGMRAAGDALTIGVSAPLLAATAASIHFATEFETNTTRLVTLSGVSEDNMQAMKRAMLEMAPAVGVGPGALSEAMLAVTSTGIRGKEALDILNISAKATAIGLGDTTTVARTVVSAVNAYGASNMTAAHAADVLYRTVVAGNAEASTLAPVLGRVTGIAAQMGISFEEVGASIATFTRLGVGADVAVTGLRDVLVHLLSPSKEAAKSFAEFGLSAAGIRKELAENGLMATLQHLMQVTGGNLDVMSDMIGDVRGLALVLGTAGAQADTYAQVLNEITNGTDNINDAHKRMKQTAGQVWNEIKAQLEVVFVEMGTNLLPTLKELAPSLKNLLENIAAIVKAFADLPTPVQTFLEAMIGLGIVGGPVLSGLARLLDMWVKIRIAILAAKAAETGGVGATAAAAAGAGTGYIGAGAVIAGGAVVGLNELGIASGGTGLFGHGSAFADGNVRGAAERARQRLARERAGLPPDIEQLFNVPGALTPMGNSGVGMVAGAQASDIVGGLEAVSTAHEKASAAAKKHAKDLENYANASKDYTTVVAQLGDDLYEGIAYDHARGVSTAALADVYKVSETVIKDVIAAEASEAKAAKEQEAAATATMARVLEFRKVGEAAQHGLQNLGPQHVLRDLAAAMGDLGPLSPKQLAGLNAVRTVTGPDGVTRTMGPGLPGDLTHGTGLGPGMPRPDDDSGHSVGDSLRGTMQAIPQILQQAFTGGGGLGGALQAVGVNFGASLFSKDGAMGGVLQKGITALFGADGVLGKTLSQAIPVIGALIGPAIQGLISVFHKPEYKKIMADSGRDWGFTFSEALAQQIQATEKKLHVGRNEATLLNLSGIIKEAGGLNDSNLAQYEAKLRDVFVGVETHTLTAAQATKVLDENFQAFATAATDKTGLLDDRMREQIALTQRFGLESKAVTEYLKTQAKDVAEGFTKVALGFTKPIQDAYDKLQALKTDGKSGREHDAQIAQAQAHLESITSPEGFARQGTLAGLTIANSRAAGMGLVESFNAIGPALDHLATIQKERGLAPDDAFAHLLALRDVINQHPELFAASDGLKSMATGLANSNAMTPEAYNAIAREALHNMQDMEGLGLGHRDALDASKETLQVLYELQRRDPSLTLTPEMQKLLDEAKDAGLVGDKQLSAAERSAQSLTHIAGGIDELVRHAGGTVPGTTPPTGPGTGPTVPSDGSIIVPPGSRDFPGGDGRDMGDSIHAMAAGGDFLVSKPTLFLAGEAGIERATFSGAGRTTHGAIGAPVVNQYTSYAITVNVKDAERARTIQDLLRQEGVEIFVEEIEDGRHAKRLQRALEAVA